MGTTASAGYSNGMGAGREYSTYVVLLKKKKKKVID